MSELLHKIESLGNSGFGTMFKRHLCTYLYLGSITSTRLPDALKRVSVPHFGDFMYVGGHCCLILDLRAVASVRSTQV